MTRRGSPEERRWRRNRNLEPGSDGSVHGEQPVDPRGRAPREKPSGHRHKDPQPAKEHGSATHDGTVADNPHGNATHDSTVAPAPHGNAAHSPGMVENAVGAPSLRRETRASQPAPANVAVGTRSVIEDEANVEEVAADTTGDGSADTWLTVSTDPAHDHDGVYVNETGDTMSGTLGFSGVTNFVESNRVERVWLRDVSLGNQAALGLEANDGTLNNRMQAFLRRDTSTFQVDGILDATGNTASSLRASRPGEGVATVGVQATSGHTIVEARDTDGTTTLGRLFVRSDGPTEAEADSQSGLRATRPSVGQATLGVVSGGHTIIEVRDTAGTSLNNIQVTTDGRLYTPNDADIVGSLTTGGGADFGGTLRVDLGGVGETRVSHGGGTNNEGYFTVADDSGNTVTMVVYGPSDDTSAPGFAFSDPIVITHGDLTLDGGDLVANKSSHGGNVVAQGWIDSQESVVASTYMRATNKMGVMTSGSATNPTIRFDASSSLGIPHCGMYKNTDASGNHRLSVAGDDNAIAGFHPASTNRSIFPRSDGGADLGDTDIAWDTVHAYNINTLSDPTLKADLRVIDSTEASERVRRTAQAAIGFRWTDGGRRTHLGFDADKVGQAHGEDSAAFVDPAVNGDEGTGSLDGSHTEPHKAIRPVELIPDLYAAVSQLLDRVDALETA